MSDLSEFLILPVESSLPMQVFPEQSVVEEGSSLNEISQRSTDFRWTVNDTKGLIDLYAKYKKKVGTLAVKTVKHMWQLIAKELSEILNINITTSNCENRWRVLERNYKKYVDNQNATGRGKKYFEYTQEMEELFGRKKSIRPEVLLTTDTIDVPIDLHDEIENREEDKKTSSDADNKIEKEPQRKHSLNCTKASVKKRKKTLAENMRQDRLEYQTKRLEIEREKLEEMRRRNNLIQERNDILKEKTCNCTSSKIA